ncbi:MAG TPA: LamG domain-containing protein, partial [Luteolibacter sp.]|nr:LamG domain-containing protein [Luteolibacter sp.]
MATLPLAGLLAVAEESRPVAWWPMDASPEGTVRDAATEAVDRIGGRFTPVAGVRGGAIRFDGYTTEIARSAGRLPKWSAGFAVEGWVALGAYPWNWCPLVSQSANEEAGFRVDIGPRGQLRMQLRVGDDWASCESEEFVVDLRRWTHLAASFDPATGITLFVNGERVGVLKTTGDPVFAEKVALVIGTGHGPAKPSHLHRDYGTLESWFSLDGIIDEVRIYDRPLDARQVKKAVAEIGTTSDPELPPRRLPSGPPGAGRFGAYYTHLQYYPEWDALWPVGGDPDVVVRFDHSPARVVFWRGTRYSPAWVSGNDLWMADQSVEAWNDEQGCFEHMQDRRCRYSHVRVIESHEARVVVHWRYAPVSAHDELWREDPKTTRACWVDEYYYIYPDVVGVRN